MLQNTHAHTQAYHLWCIRAGHSYTLPGYTDLKCVNVEAEMGILEIDVELRPPEYKVVEPQLSKVVKFESEALETFVCFVDL